ncbi:hypothetical protein AB0J90_26820 [Micromonospora sp. NPDC049523]|uniref:hypothetical protein n=1 Tax=Micromonospora sp. NPDC049523 TaxID=3155921 RepID=UPI003419C93B
MFERLGRTMVRWRWWVIALAVALIAFGGIWGTQVFGSLTTAGFDDPAFQQAVDETLDSLPNDVVTSTVTYWSTNSPTLVDEGRRSTYAVLTLAGDDETQRGEALEEIEDDLAAPGLQTQVGGITT